MNEERVREFFSDEVFVKELLEQESLEQVQELLAAGRWNRKKKAGVMQKKFTVARVKSGALRGYFLLDMTWKRNERKQFLSLIKSINNLDEVQEEGRNQNYGYQYCKH